MTAWTGHAFGLDVEAPIELFASGPPVGVPRRAVVELVGSPLTPTARDRVVREVGGTAERPALQILAREEGGYLLHAPAVGSIAVSADGRTIDCSPHEPGDDTWKQLFSAQALPLASTLQGLETLHAAAVRIDDMGVAVAADSGVGKSSVLRCLLEHGADFVADDVVALEQRSGTVIAHPGPRTVNLRNDHGSKARLAPPSHAGATPLHALYLLQRHQDINHVTLEHLDSPPAAELMSVTFNFSVRSSQRLVRMLDVFARLAATVRIVRVRSPVAGDAQATARAILSDLTT